MVQPYHSRLTHRLAPGSAVTWLKMRRMDLNCTIQQSVSVLARKRYSRSAEMLACKKSLREKGSLQSPHQQTVLLWDNHCISQHLRLKQLSDIGSNISGGLDLSSQASSSKAIIPLQDVYSLTDSRAVTEIFWGDIHACWGILQCHNMRF